MLPTDTHNLSGYVLVDKPAGMSSHSCVQQVRQALDIGGRRGTRAGHAGTLDPFATGLLLVLLGKATRLMPWVVGHDKRYLLEVAFGASSDSDDATGQLARGGASFPGEAALRDAVAMLQRTTTQLPPQVSALHVDGVRAYRLARAGEHVDLQPRAVIWHAITLVACDAERATLDVTAGSGAYMRSLARDLGELLGCGAHAHALRRLAVGFWSVDSAVACDRVQPRDVRAAGELVASLPAVHLLDAELQAFAHGQSVEVADPPEGDAVATFASDGTLAGIARVEQGVLRPDTVFAEPAAATGAQVVT